jgi:2-polyprenyl-3-methyl-5-hydroxy-6-metoxy-1,4-benzoquinol methylase
VTSSPAAPCVVCGGDLGFWFARHQRVVCRCARCGHIQVPAGVACSEDGRSIYEAEHSVFESDGNDEYYLDEGTESAARGKLAFVRQFCPGGGRLLDVGASYGHFLAAAGSAFEAYGIELNAGAVRWSINRFGVRNEVASLYELPDRLPASFDVITLWDVIEHLDDPSRALAACRERLTPGGWIFLSTPDAGALTARVLGKRWYYQDPVQHVNLFSNANLQRVLKRSGFVPRSSRHFGRSYRVRYIVNRLRYLAGDGVAGRVLAGLRHMPEAVAQGHLTIKLWDVMGIAAQRK